MALAQSSRLRLAISLSCLALSPFPKAGRQTMQDSRQTNSSIGRIIHVSFLLLFFRSPTPPREYVQESTDWHSAGTPAFSVGKTFMVPTLPRGNPSTDAPASRLPGANT
ncbi:hypothetical protein D3C78_1429800 [compost metagenome]